MSHMRTWLELHDSTLVSLRQVEDGAEMLLDGYVHQWEQVNGAWHGTGWTRTVRLVVRAAIAPPTTPASPVTIASGSLKVGSAVHENLVALPLASAAPAELRLVLCNGAIVHLHGDGIDVEVRGEGRLVEDLPSDMLPKPLA